MKPRKAQLMTHVLVFVLGLVVVGLVVLFGYNVIDDMQQDRCTVLSVQFSTSLQKAIDNNKPPGTSRLVTLQTPCQTQQVCFVDRRIIRTPSEYAYESAVDSAFSTNVARKAVKDSISTNLGVTGDRTNVYTITQQERIVPVSSFSSQEADIQVTQSGTTNPSATCIPVQAGQLEIRMRGRGQAAEVSRP